MKKELLFGAAYYLEYMPYDRLDEDMRLMKAAGMNVIRIGESTWSTLEPEDGIFDFSYIDRMTDGARRAGLKVIIGTPTYAVPSWLARLDPGVMELTSQGRMTYGPRQLMNLWNPVFRDRAERICRKMLEHTAGLPQVIGFQIDNETKHYDNMGTEVHAMFKEYLRQRYTTCEAFNAAFGLNYWSNAIHSWEDFPDLTACINGSLTAEFEKFKRALVAEYLMWQSDIVKEYKRDDQFITHNMDFEWTNSKQLPHQTDYSYGVQPGIQHLAVAKALTLNGCDVYHPTQDDLTGAEIAYAGDEIRSLSGENYLVVESQSQGFSSWTPYPGQLRLHTYSHLASGAMGQMYWNWMSIHNAVEAYWKGILSHDLKPARTYEEVAAIGAELKRIGPEAGYLKKENRAALVIDVKSLHGLRYYPVSMSEELTYNDIMRWMYDSLYEMNIECDVVDAEALEPEQYRMIITPALYSAPESLIVRLEQFVREGGVLISSFKSFVSNERLNIYHDRLPYHLTECFGMHYDQITVPGRTRLMGKKVSVIQELLYTDQAESLADYEHPYWGSYAGITHNAYGKGHAYYIGCYTDKEILKSVYRRAVCDAGLASAEMQFSWPVIIRSGVNQDGAPVHYILHYSENQETITCPYANVEDLLTGKLYEKEEEITLKDWDVLVLKEK